MPAHRGAPVEIGLDVDRVGHPRDVIPVRLSFFLSPARSHGQVLVSAEAAQGEEDDREDAE